MDEKDQPKALVYVAFGSNVGDRVGHIERMRALLDEAGLTVIRCSSLWVSEPLGMEGAAEAFINGVIELRTSLLPMALLTQLQRIEVKMGRPVDHGRNTPRVMDLDIISYGTQHIVTEKLVVPHPRVNERLFVLKPLMELAPALKLRGNSRTVTELVAMAPIMEISLYAAR